MANEIQELKFQVGEAWKGVYSSSTAYSLANVVQDPTGLSVYRSLKPGNAGHPLSDTSWWFCIIDLSTIKAESGRIAALNQAIAQDEALRVAAEELRQQHEAERVAAETQRNEAEQARISAEQARVNAESARATAEQQRITAEQGRVSAESARVQAEQARVLAETLRANAEDQRAANEQNRVAAEQQRIERAEQDHQRAESDHAAYIDSLGAFDISSYHATDGVLAKYADLTAALGTNGANIPDDLRKGGMSVKFVQSSDNKYVQYFLTKNEWSTSETDWEKVNLKEEVSQLGQDLNYKTTIEIELENNKFYTDTLYKQGSSGWVAALVTGLNVTHKGLIVKCAPRSGAYTSLTDGSDNVLWQSNNASDFPKNFDFADYPTASKLYISSEIAVISSPVVEYYDGISDEIPILKSKTDSLETDVIVLQEEIAPIINGSLIYDKINNNLVDEYFYDSSLTLGHSNAFVAQLIDITDYDSIKIYAKIRGIAAISITDSSDTILAQYTADNLPETEFIVDRTTYPSMAKIYFSNCIDLLPKTDCYIKGGTTIENYQQLNGSVVELESQVTELEAKVLPIPSLVSDYGKMKLCLETKKIYSNDYNPSKKIQLPSQFDSFTIPINISYEDGVAGWDIDISAYAINNSETATYFVSPDGNDTNNGLTPSTPLKTIGAAINKSDVNTIILLEGDYVNGTHFAADLEVTKNINIIGQGICRLKSTSSQAPLHIKNSIFVKNVIFDGGTAAVKVTLTTETVAFYRCKFLNSGVYNGLNGVGGKYILEECEASNNMRDGFNYHRNTVDSVKYNPQSIEINCCGYFNGINHDSYINNGSTTHEAGRIIRIYCDYAFCKGGVVADSDGCASFNICVNSSCTQNIDGEDDARKTNFGSQGVNNNMYLISCISYGSLYDCYADDRSHVYRTSVFQREGYTGTGTIESYIIQYQS